MPGISSVADIEAIEATPLADRNLPPSTYDAIRQAAEKHPQNRALAFFLQATAYENALEWTFTQLLGKLHQAANMFHDLGIGPTDTVSYILPNLPQTYLTLYGGEAAGIANPINPLLEPETLADIMNAAETKVLVTIGPFPKTDIWEKVSGIVDQVETLETILRVDLAQYLGGLQKFVVKLMRLGKSGPAVRARVLDFDQTMAKYPSDRLVSGRQIQPGDVASYFHTGGTTGTPKLALHTHANEVYDGWALGRSLETDSGKMTLLGLPLFHNYGAIAIALSSWFSGSGVLIATPSGFRGEGLIPNFWKILDHYKVAVFGGVPTVFKALLDVPIGDADLSNLEIAGCGAAPLPVELAKQFTEKTGIPILEGYGLTEGTSVSTTNPRGGEQKIGSIGYRLPYQEIRVAEVAGAEFKRFCEPDEVGVLLVRGPNVFPGYKEEFHNQGALIDSGDGQGLWLNTGDLGRQDEDGYFWLTGRKKELIIRGGHNIDPKQIEEPLYEHPSVGLVAAVGRPDARVGELPVVYVELNPGMSATEEELMAFAQAHIGERAAVPKQIYIVDEIPQTAVGKLFKPALSRAQVQQVYEQELSAMDSLASFTVQVDGDKRLGTVAHVSVTPVEGADKAAVETAVTEALGQYTVYFQVAVK